MRSNRLIPVGMVMRPLKRCAARPVGDQMYCGACGLTWDTNDPDRPICRPVDKRTKLVKAATDSGLSVLEQMQAVYDENGGGLGGMAAVRQLVISCT